MNIRSCLRYCKSTIFQANHNASVSGAMRNPVVCDTAKVRFFKQITTKPQHRNLSSWLFAILQKYDFSSKSQLPALIAAGASMLFAILQKYDFSSKSQPRGMGIKQPHSCLRYCKSTIFQANHNCSYYNYSLYLVVCDTAKVRFFKQITTNAWRPLYIALLFAILQKYDFSSKSQLVRLRLRYCMLFAILQKYDFSSKSQRNWTRRAACECCLRYCKSTIFQANHNTTSVLTAIFLLFAILEKYDFSSKSQLQASKASG